MYFTVAQIVDNNVKYATLLYCGGDDLRRIHKTLLHLRVLEHVDNTTNPATKTAIDEYTASIAVLNDYFTPNRHRCSKILEHPLNRSFSTIFIRTPQSQN